MFYRLWINLIRFLKRDGFFGFVLPSGETFRIMDFGYIRVTIKFLVFRKDCKGALKKLCMFEFFYSK